MEALKEKKRKVEKYLSDKDPADYGAKRIGPVGPPGAHVGRTYDTTNLIMVRLYARAGGYALCLSDGVVTEDVSDKSVEEIIETIEEWAQTLREELPQAT